MHPLLKPRKENQSENCFKTSDICVCLLGRRREGSDKRICSHHCNGDTFRTPFNNKLSRSESTTEQPCTRGDTKITNTYLFTP